MGSRIAAALAAAILLSGVPAAAAQDIVLKMGHFIPPDSSYLVAVQSVPDRIARATGGRVKVELYSTLIQVRDQPSALRDGRLDMVAAVHPFMSGTAPTLSTGELPGLFYDIEDYKLVLDSFLADEHRKVWERQFNGVVLALGAFDRMVIVSKKPLNRVEDFRGLKIRVPSAPASQLMITVGARPVQLVFAEIAPALSSGVVDAVLTDAGTSRGMGFYNIAKYLHVWRTGVVSWAMVINKDVWGKLPADVRDVIQAEFRAIESDHFRNYASHSDSIIASMKEKGMTVIAPGDPEIKRMYSEANLSKVYDAFIALAEKTGVDNARQIVSQSRSVLKR